MKIKDAITEFDKTQKEQEEALKNVTENTKPVEQEGEAKSEGEFVEQPQAEDVPDNETDQKEQLKADAEEAEAKVEEAEEGKEDEGEDKAEDEEKVEAKEEPEAEEEPEAKEEADEEVKEEEAEKSVEDEEPTEKAKVTDKEDQDKKNKETKEDVNDSLKDKDDEDEEKDKEPKKKKKEEKAKKSEEDVSDLENLVGVVLKSYQQSVAGQNAMLDTINELKAQVESLNSKLEQTTDVEEETSKSILNDETENEEVEDKAVGYVSKNMTPEAEVAVEEDHNNDGEEANEAKEDTFVYSEHSQKFMEKFQQDLRTDALSRRDVDSHRQAFLDASEGNASENALASLYEYINN